MPSMGVVQAMRDIVARAVAVALIVVAGQLALASTVTAIGPLHWQVWLDRPLPTDARPGSSVHIGFIVWNLDDASTVNIYGFAVHLHPATGTGAVEIAAPKEDWPGHLYVDVVVPAGGFGRAEFGFGWAEGDVRVFQVAGVGPPPQAPLRLIGTVRVDPSLPIVTGQATAVDLTFEPRVAWPPESLTLPDMLTLRVRVPRQDSAQEVPATLVDRLAARYRASVVLDLPGAYILEAAMRPGATAQERFTDTEVRVEAEAPGSASSPAGSSSAASPRPSSQTSSPAQSSSDSGVPIIAIAIVALVAGLGLVALARFLRAEW